MINMKIYEETNRTIIVFENPDGKTKNIIQSVLSSVQNGQIAATPIQNLEPVELREEPIDFSRYTESVNTPVAPVPSAYVDIKAMIASDTNGGFTGYCNGWEILAKVKPSLTIEEYTKMKADLDEYTQYIYGFNVDAIPDEGLIYMITEGSRYIFSKKIPALLQMVGMASLEDFLNSGRANLVDGFLYLIGRC